MLRGCGVCAAAGAAHRSSTASMVRVLIVRVQDIWAPILVHPTLHPAPPRSQKQWGGVRAGWGEEAAARGHFAAVWAVPKLNPWRIRVKVPHGRPGWLRVVRDDCLEARELPGVHVRRTLGDVPLDEIVERNEVLLADELVEALRAKRGVEIFRPAVRRGQAFVGHAFL